MGRRNRENQEAAVESTQEGTGEAEVPALEGATEAPVSEAGSDSEVVDSPPAVAVDESYSSGDINVHSTAGVVDQQAAYEEAARAEGDAVGLILKTIEASKQEIIGVLLAPLQGVPYERSETSAEPDANQAKAKQIARDLLTDISEGRLTQFTGEGVKQVLQPKLENLCEALGV